MLLKSEGWQFIFCRSCGKPTPPDKGMKADNNQFYCDKCMNTDGGYQNETRRN